ncbi:hypothetical protein lerEdw1_009960 [Lerista edwardsae]|nr:hypothetical protein lerEdw1_009960 [Lerista edwardsae]
MAVKLLCTWLALLCGPCAASSLGRDFVTAFLANSWKTQSRPKFEVLITGYHPATTVTVSVAKPQFQKTITVNEGETIPVRLSTDIEMVGSNLFDGTVRVQADKDISVLARNNKFQTTGTTVVYPVNQLGTLYYTLTPAGDWADTYKEFAVVAYQNPTKVTIDLKGSVTFKGQTYSPGSKLVVDLTAFQAIQLQSRDDLSGSKVESEEPVAVLSGHSCAYKVTSCDHVVEQLLPASSWGTAFIALPLPFPTQFDSVYVVASQETSITLPSGTRDVVAGEVLQLAVQDSQPLFISANAGIQVLFFFGGAIQGSAAYDPFLVNIPAITSYCTSYHVDGMNEFDNYAALIAKTSESSKITLQKAAIENLQWRPIPGTEYSWADQSMGTENSALSLEHPSVPFGVLNFGVSQYDGYGSVAACSSSKCSLIQCRKKEKCEIKEDQPVCVPESEATCWAQGDPHYHTFDGRNFDFMGTCTYTIAKTCGPDTTLPSFSIEAKNENRGGNTRVSYAASVTIRVYNITISVVSLETGLVRVNYQQSRLPISLHGGKLRLYQSGGSVFIETDFSLKVSYDWNSFLVVKISSSFSENLCGLCGNYNGDPADDFSSPDKALAPGPVEFGQSWKVEDGDTFCQDDCQGGCKTCPAEEAAKYKAEASCGLISKEANGPFSQCHSVVDPNVFLDNCVYDLCLNDGRKNTLCGSLKNYADACQREGVTISDWRMPTGCSLPCPENSQYTACGSPCPATCNDQAGPSNCGSLPCVETCQCNEGFVLDAGECIPKASCGCVFEGKLFAPGEQFWGDSSCTQRCVCDPQSKQVTCQAEQCKVGEQCKVKDGIRNCYPASDGSSSASGDPHYISLDGLRFDFQGTCVYQYAGVCVQRDDLIDFHVYVQNDHRGSQSVSFTKLVQVTVYGDSIVISRDHPGKVMVNGFLTNLPYKIQNNKVSIYRRGQEAVVQAAVPTDFLVVTFDWQSRMTLAVPRSYRGTLCGLAGNFNDNKRDDLLMRDGTLAPNPTAFGQSWKVRDEQGCTDVDKGECPGFAAFEAQQRNLNKECGLLLDKSGPFRACHDKVDPEGYFRDCVYDYCSFKGQQAVICPLIASYVADCQAAGATVYAWRSDTFCSLPCTQNSHYELCATDCVRSCSNFFIPVPCTGKCQESCVCDDNFVLSGDQCVSIAQCGCFHTGQYFLAGETFYPTCQERCKCQAGGTVDCEALTCGPHEDCHLENGIQKCYPVGRATCAVTGGVHYITFDQSSFDFHGTCTYTLAKTKTNNQNPTPFTVNVENGLRKDGKISAPKMVSVNVYGITLTLLKDKPAQVKVDNSLYLLPVTLSGGQLKAYLQGTKVVIQSDFGLLVSYDLAFHVTVTIPGNYQDQVGGLCGNYNSQKNDDFQLPDGRAVTDVTAFGAAWKVPVPGADGTCSDQCPGNECPVCEEKKEEVFRQRNYCGILTADDGPFGDCHFTVDPDVYFDNCIYDVCRVNGDPDILCQSIESYASACQDAKAYLESWRTPSLCPLTCPANSHYEVCANLCSITCAKITDPETCPQTCAEGCQCDDGFFFDGRACVTAENCGCFKNGRYFQAGETIFAHDCLEKCTCHPSGQLTCEESRCAVGETCALTGKVRRCVRQDGQCTLEPGAWLTSFDGAKGKLLSNGVYKLAAFCNEKSAAWFKVVVDVSDCGEDSVPAGTAVYVFFREAFITVTNHQETWVNGLLVQLPQKISEAVSITEDQGSIVVTQSSRVQIVFSPNGRVSVTVAASLAKKMCAPCGNFNGDASDDLRLPSGQIAGTIAEVIDAWKARDFSECYIQVKS